MIHYRNATAKDVAAIAHLHAQSWSDNYRGSFDDAYLDGPVFPERLEVWQKRFAIPDPTMHIILAEEANQLIGFVCLFLDHNPEWGSLVDNLHVSKISKGKGVGKVLMKQATQYIQSKASKKQTYLYVLAKNKEAIGFYKKINGRMDGRELFDDPGGGGQSEVYRFVWD